MAEIESDKKNISSSSPIIKLPESLPPPEPNPILLKKGMGGTTYVDIETKSVTGKNAREAHQQENNL